MGESIHRPFVHKESDGEYNIADDRNDLLTYDTVGSKILNIENFMGVYNKVKSKKSDESPLSKYGTVITGYKKKGGTVMDTINVDWSVPKDIDSFYYDDLPLNIRRVI